LPAPGPQGRGNSPVAKTDDYVSLLGLFSHEYFHAWHVKRIRPAAHINADLSSESYTRLLWVFEGITSYYDDLALVRSGLIDAKVYLGLLAQSITRLWRTGGRRHQSLVESSFDAWIKFYKADENASNSQVSYYGKGALVALALDLSLRAQSSGQISLDMVMKALWHRYGQTGVGLPEDGLEGLVEELAGPSMAGFFDHYVYGTQDPPLKALLGAVGVILAEAPAKSPDDLGGYGDGTAAENWPRVWLGAKYAATDGGLKLQQVYEGGSAQVAGLVPGDIIVAIDGWRCDNKVLQAWQKSAAVGSQAALHAFRGNELLNITLAALAAPMDTCYLSLVAETSQDVFQAREAWLQSLSNL
jgi:predicted metalloprotease with PDZ domain